MTDLHDETGTAVVIVGGVILGAVTAWELAYARVPCILLESMRFGQESTGKSAAIVRMHYSNPQVVRMALRSRQAFNDIPELLGVDPVYNRTGWIFLVDEHDRENAITNRAMQTAEGSHSVEVPLDELGEYLPGLSLDGITYALFEEDSGSADPSATTAAYVSAARRLGAYAYEHARVTEILVEGGAVKGVRVKGQVIACETVVLAAGGWSPALARTAGVDLPIRLTREQDVVFHTGAEAPPPMSVSAQVDRTYMRPLIEEGSSLLLVGRGFPKPYDYVTTDDCNWDLDQVFIDDVRTRLTERFPALRELRLRDGRVGLYSVTPDWHPLLGPVNEVEGLHLATGGSGHCFKLGPAIGAMVAGTILGTPVDCADIRDFRLGRFAAGETFQSTYGGNRA